MASFSDMAEMYPIRVVDETHLTLEWAPLVAGKRDGSCWLLRKGKLRLRVTPQQ